MGNNRHASAWQPESPRFYSMRATNKQESVRRVDFSPRAGASRAAQSHRNRRRCTAATPKPSTNATKTIFLESLSPTRHRLTIRPRPGRATVNSPDRQVQDNVHIRIGRPQGRHVARVTVRTLRKCKVCIVSSIGRVFGFRYLTPFPARKLSSRAAAATIMAAVWSGLGLESYAEELP